MMIIQYETKTLPVLHVCDLVIQGGTFAALSAALAAVEQGKRVAVIEARTYLGWEMTACLRPWIHKCELETFHTLPPIIEAIIKPECYKLVGDELIFSIDKVKVNLESVLLASGIKILYASRVIDTIIDGGSLQGVVIGNKSCRQVIQCDEYFDFSMFGWESSLSTINPDSVWRTLEFTNLDLSACQNIPLPEFLGVDTGVFNFHRGFFNERHWLVEFPNAINKLQSRKNLHNSEIFLQDLVYQTARYLLRTQPAFKGAYWAGASDDSYPWATGLLENILRSKPVNVDWKETNASTRVDEKVIYVSEMDVFSHTATQHVDVPGREVPIIQKVDVLVVGGGTSGTVAAITAAENGMQTMLVEMNPRLGGTGTIGGVHSYWYGRETGFTSRLMKEIEVQHQELHQAIPEGKIPKWNIETKASALLKIARDRNVQVVFNWLAIGTLTDEQRVMGVVFATTSGLVGIEARVAIDATGDGDLAAFAGAQFTYGSHRNRSTMWYSLAQYTEPGKTKNNFTSMVEIGNIEDYTRAIISARRWGGECADHGSYLATRESRQIHGEAQITLTDQLRQRKYQDVIQIAYSNYDVKGHSDSDWIRAGLIPPNLEIEIPLGAVIPKGLEGLLVIGKAISATHDALPSIRMQRDLENLGGAVGIIAAIAVKQDGSPRALPIRDIQKKLVNEGILPLSVLTRSITPQVFDVDNLLGQLSAEKPLNAYSDMEMDEIYRDIIPFVEICCLGKAALPQIRDAFLRADGKLQMLLAQVLAMMGDAGGVEILVDAIMEQLGSGLLPSRSQSIRNTQLPPDQGAMPDVVYWLYSLGMVRDPRAILVYEKVANALSRTSVEDFYSQTKGTYYYIDAICYGVERLGDKRCSSVLYQLQELPYLKNQVLTDVTQEDFVKDRLAFLELTIARAMIRCGLKTGIPTLINYLNDVRAPLREHAYELLVNDTGMDFKLDVEEWLRWYKQTEIMLTPKPDITLTEAQQNW
jgi:ribulose 1,5-bisphosphate synthetase/thiazole synthase